MSSRAELARQRAQEEKLRIEALQKRSAEEAADLVSTGTAVSVAGNGNSAPKTGGAGTPPAAEPPKPAIGVSADTPIMKQKVDRQGIDLRPLDRERWERFEMFCLTRRLKLGKKKGLTLYARAGLQLLDELLTKDEAAVEALLRSLGERPTT